MFTPELPLPAEWRAFLHTYAHLSPPEFALKAAQAGLPHHWLADQHKARLKAIAKLPEWVATEGVVLPPVANLEQASGAETAAFKATLVSGTRFADLTGGVGADTLAMARTFSEGYYLEQDAMLCRLAQHNFPLLGAAHVQVLHKEASEWTTLYPPPDVLYLDPSRREDGRRLRSFDTYSPAPAPILEAALSRGCICLVKCSPMDNIPTLLQQFHACNEVYIVAVGREVKEVLLLFRPGASSEECPLEAVMLGRTWDRFLFTASEEKQASVAYAMPQRFLYDLHPALMKAGAFRLAAMRYGVQKLHSRTHLYTSQEYVPHFPGRAWELLAMLKPSAAALRPYLPHGAAHVLTRNYPLSSEALMALLKLKEGGELFVIGCTLCNDTKALLLCKLVEG